MFEFGTRKIDHTCNLIWICGKVASASKLNFDKTIEHFGHQRIKQVLFFGTEKY